MVNLLLKAIRMALSRIGATRFGVRNFNSLGHWDSLLPRNFDEGIPWVLNRTACLGSDVLKIAFPEIKSARRFHLQKVRIDYLAEHIGTGLFRRRNLIPLSVRSAMVREDGWGHVNQQNSYLIGQRHPPIFCLIDSYSELTDQKFVDTKSGSYFHANYSDVSEEALADGSIFCEGPLNLDDAMEHFENFISSIKRSWGPVPIFLLAYPKDLESRQKFLTRAVQLDSIFEVLTHTYENVHLIAGPAGTVEADEKEIVQDEVFPYHYGERVKQELARNLLESWRSASLFSVTDSGHFSSGAPTPRGGKEKWLREVFRSRHAKSEQTVRSRR